MGERKITLTIDEAMYSELSEKAKLEGFGRVSTLVRHLVISDLKASIETADRRVIKMPVENYRELAEYVAGKKLSNIETFARYVMGLHMAKYPLSEAQKEQVGKSFTD